MKASALFYLSFLFAIPQILHAQAKDVPNSQDHPIVSRFAGSVIKFYDTKTFDAYSLRLGSIDRGKESAAQKQDLEGAVTRIIYQSPKTNSVLEVFRNYEQALVQGGFEQMFRCELGACGTGFSGSYPSGSMGHVRGFVEQQRYLAMQRSDDNGTQYVAVFIVMTHDGPVTRLDVVEMKPMKTGQVTVSAAQLKSDFEKTGKAVIQQIYFESGKAVLKPESKPALEEVAKFLKERSDLNIYVVGHTDSDGGFDFNQQLSQQRAQAVVDQLVKTHSIASNRLIAKGVSYLCPVADNSTDAGKAKNRRVELVRQ
ncbi:MAG: DUF4892 domain-containing protein [Haliscomenobacteraceae bacterium CHB4]|nr:hypothetical protein [Saprospiraceae bacterium]MCE7921716.1 DUF4892 domain-containing protein [Haliscomenobacteraceae bacterium CHB4]